MNKTKNKIFSLILAGALLCPSVSHADATKEFLLSSTYGLLAGTLVGAATLAFEDKPGDSLKNIAQGASLGLYGGMILGAYLVYAVPSASDIPGDYEDIPTDESGTEGDVEETSIETFIYPMITENKIDGVGFGMRITTF